MANTLTCIYCGANNPSGTNRCKACGAPIDLPVVRPVSVTTVNTNSSILPPPPISRPDTTPDQIRDALDAAPINDQLKEGLKAAGMGIGALGVGSFIARTAAEAASIAISSFLIAYFAASSGRGWLGILGGVLIGLMVGLVIKRPLGVLFSAPLGTVLGLVAGTILQSGLPGLPLPPLLGLIGGSVLAVLGGRRNSSNVVSKWYGRFRPFLGMMGGFLFALFGLLIGGIIH